eukprot:13926231-Alexandrium_andersonii.AAC.1
MQLAKTVLNTGKPSPRPQFLVSPQRAQTQVQSLQLSSLLLTAYVEKDSAPGAHATALSSRECPQPERLSNSCRMPNNSHQLTKVERTAEIGGKRIIASATAAAARCSAAAAVAAHCQASGEQGPTTVKPSQHGVGASFVEGLAAPRALPRAGWLQKVQTAHVARTNAIVEGASIWTMYTDLQEVSDVQHTSRHNRSMPGLRTNH